MNDINIDQITIGKNHKLFIVAEMSGNHNKSFKKSFGNRREEGENQGGL